MSTPRPSGAIRVSAPATSANLGPGFDCLAVALDLHNTVEVLAGERGSGLRIDVQGEGHATVARDASNLIVVAMERLAAGHGLPLPRDLHLRLDNRIPLGRGLGSSAAAIASGLLAGAALLQRPAAPEALLLVALGLESHPDNVVAALWGGFTIGVLDHAGPIVRRVEPPTDLLAVLLVPEAFVSTALSRGVLAPRVERSDAVFNASRCALFVADLLQGRLEGLRTAMQDRLHQPQRAANFPYLDAAIEGALEAGAFGAALSGSGSSVIALAPRRAAPAVAEALSAAAARYELRASTPVYALSARGAAQI